MARAMQSAPKCASVRVAGDTMPKALRDYTWADWKRLRPLAHRLKTARYQWIDRRYRRKPALVGDPAAVARDIAGRKVLVTVAYMDPEAIDLQATLLRHFFPDSLYVVVDNSPDDDIARQIARVAAARSVAYLRAPENPWKKSSRSHGIALNWAWHNVIRPGAPEAFGLLDHDLFPTAPDDPFAPLATQDFYGYVRAAEPANGCWYLWPGFSMLRFHAVQHLDLDFGQDWFLNLDTGGGNWEPLYSRYDLDRLAQSPSRFVPYRDGIGTYEGPLQWCGSWLHEVGQMGRPDVMRDKRRVVKDILSPHLEAARGEIVAA
ncbi:hypothetical protein RPD_2546 [Rhodopseudomonas palustris BisB5]|uniref:Glycosyltransferase n=1 Tax=Rhodopseudomonas palustris (strain BisB5) TaxID=316057 RepID=Q137G3_RHOPS|nr:hypothetical protein RPD_2546 [Rhodopseudomonas palustris BisB5]